MESDEGKGILAELRMIRGFVRIAVLAGVLCLFSVNVGAQSTLMATVGFRAKGIKEESLKPSGTVSATKDGQIIEKTHIRGVVEIQAKNVVIRECKITADGYWPVRVFPGASLTIEYTEIAATRKAEAAIGADNETARYTARFLDIHGSVDGMRASTGSRIENCYIHDLSVVPGETHNDGIQMMAGRDVLIKDNVIDLPAGCNSAIILQTDFGRIKGVRIEGNYLNGGAYTIFSRIGNASGKTPPEGVEIIGNRFGLSAVYGFLSVDGQIVFQDNTRPDGSLIDLN